MNFDLYMVEAELTFSELQKIEEHFGVDPNKIGLLVTKL